MNKQKALIIYVLFAVVLVLVLSFGTDVAKGLVADIKEYVLGYDITDVELALDPDQPLTANNTYQLDPKPIGSFSGSGDLKLESSEHTILHIDSAGKITTFPAFDGPEATVEVTITSAQDRNFSKTLRFTVKKEYPKDFDCHFIVKGYDVSISEIAVGMVVYPYANPRNSGSDVSNEFEVIYNDEYFRYDENENGYIAIKETPVSESICFTIRYPDGREGNTKSFSIIPYTQIDSFDEVRIFATGENADGLNYTCDKLYIFQLFKDGSPVQSKVDITCSMEGNLITNPNGRSFFKDAGDCTLTFSLPNGFSKTISTPVRNILSLPTLDDKDFESGKSITIYAGESTTVNFTAASDSTYPTITVEAGEGLEIAEYWRSFTLRASKPGKSHVKIVLDDGVERIEQTYTVEVIKDTRYGTMIKKFVQYFVSKVLGHLCFFGALGICAVNYLRYITTKRRIEWIGLVFALGLPWAGLTEFIQIFMADRTAALTDVLIDMSGYLLGALVGYFGIKLIIKHIESKEQNDASDKLPIAVASEE